MNTQQIEELLLHSLEHEFAGTNVYEMAIACAIKPDVNDVWESYLAETEYDSIEDQEDERLCHSKGWCLERWLESHGIEAVLPPPEQRLKVKTAIGAARAEQSVEKAR